MPQYLQTMVWARGWDCLVRGSQSQLLMQNLSPKEKRLVSYTTSRVIVEGNKDLDCNGDLKMERLFRETINNRLEGREGRFAGMGRAQGN